MVFFWDKILRTHTIWKLELHRESNWAAVNSPFPVKQPNLKTLLFLCEAILILSFCLSPSPYGSKWQIWSVLQIRVGMKEIRNRVKFDRYEKNKIQKKKKIAWRKGQNWKNKRSTLSETIRQSARKQQRKRKVSLNLLLALQEGMEKINRRRKSVNKSLQPWQQLCGDVLEHSSALS